MPKLSIITINLNNHLGLRKTIESVISQTSKDFEYIVIDGGSTDGSIEIINEFSDSISYLVSEPDNGIYQAMNKGILAAKGKYCQFLNSGDWLVDNQVVANMLIEIPECDIFLGSVIVISPKGKLRYYKSNAEISFYTFYRSTIFHTSAYIRRALFDQYGLYDETLRIVADWKWYLVVTCFHNANVKTTLINVCFFDSTGISSKNKNLDKIERRKVLEELVPTQILSDYDKYSFDIEQMIRIKKHPVIYQFFWYIERLLFKIEKWNSHWGK
jgi:glycosyltransferase involved in cell wall biosynthesis